ncbi:MAG: alanine--tRNA ligase-related protein [Oscillospiraceae bacterium]
MDTTKKLFDDGHLKTFDATVLSCEPLKKGFGVILDKTAFFPEGGGQLADVGTLNHAKVSDVKIKNEIITHIVDKPLEVGSTVHGEIDWNIRFRRMQNHSGEHIVSGIIHSMFGYDNVGFHMGTNEVTLDVNGLLTDEDIKTIEYKSNLAVTSNAKVTVTYPSSEVLANLDYRSKLDITENVRIVTIDGYDMCACCAPHVNYTGEIGIIKILDAIHYKGGMRISMLCGLDALEDYSQRNDSILKISALLSAKQKDVFKAVERLNNEIMEQKQISNKLKSQILQIEIDKLKKVNGNLCLFEQDFDMLNIRNLANEGVKFTDNICAVFSGSDDTGYMYVMSSKNIPLRDKAKEINATLKGKGGGSNDMIQGSVSASKSEILSYFNVED